MAPGPSTVCRSALAGIILALVSCTNPVAAAPASQSGAASVHARAAAGAAPQYQQCVAFAHSTTANIFTSANANTIDNPGKDLTKTAQAAALTLCKTQSAKPKDCVLLLNVGGCVGKRPNTSWAFAVANDDPSIWSVGDGPLRYHPEVAPLEALYACAQKVDKAAVDAALPNGWTSATKDADQTVLEQWCTLKDTIRGDTSL